MKKRECLDEIKEILSEPFSELKALRKQVARLENTDRCPLRANSYGYCPQHMPCVTVTSLDLKAPSMPQRCKGRVELRPPEPK